MKKLKLLISILLFSLSVKGQTIDTTQVILGIIREEVTTFEHYYVDANYYPVGDSIIILRQSVELGYKVGFKYFDWEWNSVKPERIVFVKPK